jgi:uncharacterized membrane protein YoaK (UPF0700 family)
MSSSPALSMPARDRVGVMALSLAAGVADVLGLLVLDVFASAVTGNMAQLAIAIGSGHSLAASRSLCVILAFALGVLIGKAVGRTLQRLLILELACLVAAAVLCSASSPSPQGGSLYAIVALLAFAMGVQARIAQGGTYAGTTTSVFTMNVVKVLSAPANNPIALRALAAFAVGALLAATLAPHWLVSVVWLPPAAVLVALACAQRNAHETVSRA